MDSKPIRRPCFTEEDDGLASIAGTAEAGFSGHHHHHHPPPPLLSTRPLYHTSALQSRGSLRNLSFISLTTANSPRSGYFYDVNRFEEMNQPHFLDACFLCKKPLSDNKDIFMYRGDTPFCSEECRREQIEKDEAKENKLNRSVSLKALRKDQKMNSNSNSTTNSPNKHQKNYPFPTSTVAAA
ncbi:hypothetical protein Vadar_029923 [Vaccinium darrowii]|uniref:Uncharacterized protein n=1 Tax=Vaccinium darrowii TaxID=229202 RepID=A0ACB7ZEY3_9ERIC|nr:hypothetical protein Vadar_029923 [Vaccinium darrowii]